MNEKLSSDKVPQKFSDWLLGMGCPAEKVPSIEKMNQMCRGQYYMVWRSLMEHIEAKDLIRQKRLQVFCNDIKMCQENNVFNEHSSNIILPEELRKWKQQNELKQEVEDAEYRIAHSLKTQKELQNKITSKINQRNYKQQQIGDLQRRNWFLQQVAGQLSTKKASLEETKCISDSLCTHVTECDVQRKLDKCLLPSASRPCSIPNPMASSSLVSLETDSTDRDENIKSLVNCRGDVLWPHLHEKRSALIEKLSSENTKQKQDVISNATTPQTVLAHTAALHASLSLQAMKNKLQLQHTKDNFAAAVDENMISYMSGESCQLLVLRCEKARLEARVKSFKSLLTELSVSKGVFSVEGVNEQIEATPREIASIDKCIVNSRNELKRLISSLVTTERKITNIKDCLVGIFNSFQNNTAVDEAFRGVLLDFPKEPISILKQFYTERCEKTKNGNLSTEFEVSDCSYSEVVDTRPTFIDELKVYLKKFNLEKNRKLVLDSADQIWIFETVKHLSSKLLNDWAVNDLTLCPSVRLRSTIKQLIDDVQESNALESIIKEYNVKDDICNIDIKSSIMKEEMLSDKLKKCISDNTNLLGRINKTLDISQENLQFWSESNLKKYISPTRTVDGKTYKECETFYLENISLNL